VVPVLRRVSGSSLPVLTLVFTAPVAVIWVAAIQLSSQTDVLATRLRPGRQRVARSCSRSRPTCPGSRSA